MSMDGVRRKVVRRQIWQALSGWFRSGDRDDSAASRAMVIAVSSSPMVVNEALDTERVFEEADATLADDELLEFLEADADPVPADPEFRERLRERLWGMVKGGVTALPKDH
jgi:hypothetical protein